jgi:hypothetical protein
MLVHLLAAAGFVSARFRLMSRAEESRFQA